MTERRIGGELHPGFRDPASTSGRTPYRDPRPAPDPTLAARFAAALSIDPGASPHPTSDKEMASLPSPFLVFTPDEPASDADEATVNPVAQHQGHGHQRLLDTVIDLADRIMVDLGDQGRREVRVDLADDVLPGVSVSVHQQHGEWVADFLCSDLRSHQRLSEPAAQMAIELASVLRAPARWRVALIDAPQALVESSAHPPEEQST